MKKLFSILFVFCFAFCFSQEKRISFEEKQKIKEDSIVQRIQSELKEKGVEEYFYFEKYIFSTNVHVYEDNFEESFLDKEYEYYFFWKENKQCFVKKFDNKNNFSIYKPNKIKCFDLFSLSNKDIEIIKGEIVKPIEYIKENREVAQLWISNSRRIMFNFIKKDKVIKNEFYDFFIDKEYNQNINHKHNQSLKIVQLYNKCEEIISELEEKNLFVKEE